MLHKTYQELQSSYLDKRALIKSRLREFKQVFDQGDNRRVFEELVFCIFTANASAMMGLKAVDAVKDVLMDADIERLSDRLQHVHRFPNARARYIVHTRDFVKREFNFKLKDMILSFSGHLERRDFFAGHKDIKGIGYKEASHFLRNIGFRGYAILDKHILQSLYEFGIIDNPKPPATRDKYLQIENKFKEFANNLEIDFDELDLLLWSEKAGEILK